MRAENAENRQAADGTGGLLGMTPQHHLRVESGHPFPRLRSSAIAA